LDALDDQKDPDSAEFEDAKRVIKELLFNGANRSLEGKFNLHILDNSMEFGYV
jgi:hypothetical protein